MYSLLRSIYICVFVTQQSGIRMLSCGCLDLLNFLSYSNASRIENGNNSTWNDQLSSNHRWARPAKNFMGGQVLKQDPI
jgi:hypothetical protein